MTEIAARVLNEGRQAHADATLALFGADQPMSVGRETQRCIDQLLHRIAGPVSQAALALDDFLDERKK